MARATRADLNPPLGKPGGPCYVVRRIEEEATPSLRERLVNKVEEGQDLSNPEAAEVYEIDVERTRGFVPRLLVGPHTQYRMDLRGVTVRDLKDAVEEMGKAYHAARKNGDARRLQPFEAFLAGQKLTYLTRRGLEVVLVPGEGGARVVTTYWKGRADPTPPGHCDPLVERVAARYARRTIQLDTRAVQLLGSELAEKAIERLLRALPEALPVGKSLGAKETIVSDTLELGDVRGQKKRFVVIVSHRPGNQASPTAGGHFEPASSTVRLFVNSVWPPKYLSEERHKVMANLSSFLVHEVTHGLDVLPDGSYEGAEGEKSVYYNQPAEFRAYAKQIVTDVLNRWKMTLRRNPKKSGAELVEAALESSPNYEKVKGHFDRRNHQRLRQIVVTELQQAGFLPS